MDNVVRPPREANTDCIDPVAEEVAKEAPIARPSVKLCRASAVKLSKTVGVKSVLLLELVLTVPFLDSFTVSGF